MEVNEYRTTSIHLCGMHTVFLVSPVPNAFCADNLFDFWEQFQLLVVVMTFDEAEPRLGVADELGFVLVCYVRCLQIYRIVPAEDCVVDMRHVRSAEGEHVGLLHRKQVAVPVD